MPAAWGDDGRPAPAAPRLLDGGTSGTGWRAAPANERPRPGRSG
jgi:hypothetical protein